MSEETTYYSKGDVTVTNARVVISGATYAMSNITSIKTGTKPSSVLPYALIIVVGIFIAAMSSGTFGNLVAFAVIIGGFVLLFNRKPDHVVIIGSASGETNALTSKSKEEVQGIVNAVNEAIIKRG